MLSQKGGRYGKEGDGTYAQASDHIMMRCDLLAVRENAMRDTDKRNSRRGDDRG
jgi:hypothetical protein